MLRRGLFLALGLAALTPWVPAAAALVAGLIFALTLGNPFPEASKRWQPRLLQGSVVGLGAAMNLGVVARVGLSGLGQTFLTLSLTLATALLLAKLLRTEPTTSLLVGVGTAICGGSAIAAVAPAIGAKSHQASVALAVVFLLNAAALVIFPAVGHLVALTPAQFGLWSALAIHDTSSVVGAALQFGGEALAVGTTVKLARALWILPLTLVLARLWPHEGAGGGAAKRPYFILGFLAVAALVTWVPALATPGAWVAAAARRLLVATLFLVGAGVSREALRQVGVRPLVLGGLLWALVLSATLALIHAGVLAAPAL